MFGDHADDHDFRWLIWPAQILKGSEHLVIDLLALGAFLIAVATLPVARSRTTLD